MSRFDPDPDRPYATCTQCPEVMQDETAMRAHFKATMQGGRSHRVSITNPTRTERIEQELDRIADDALYEFTNGLDELILSGDVTEAEIDAAVITVTRDFADAWKDSK